MEAGQAFESDTKARGRTASAVGTGGCQEMTGACPLEGRGLSRSACFHPEAALLVR